jgi:hypothetical protein
MTNNYNADRWKKLAGVKFHTLKEQIEDNAKMARKIKNELTTVFANAFRAGQKLEDVNLITKVALDDAKNIAGIQENIEGVTVENAGIGETIKEDAVTDVIISLDPTSKQAWNEIIKNLRILQNGLPTTHAIWQILRHQIAKR